jgi:hypothetical protein
MKLFYLKLYKFNHQKIYYKLHNNKTNGKKEKLKQFTKLDTIDKSIKKIQSYSLINRHTLQLFSLDLELIKIK